MIAAPCFKVLFHNIPVEACVARNSCINNSAKEILYMHMYEYKKKQMYVKALSSLNSHKHIVCFLLCHEENYTNYMYIYLYIFKLYYMIKYYSSLNYCYLYGSDAFLLKSQIYPRIP